jgi:hypothetical protein
VRRIFWLALGLGAGATSAVLAGRWARQQAQRVAPSHLARQLGKTVQELGAVVAEAGREFSRAMTEKETEIRSSLDK